MSSPIRLDSFFASSSSGMDLIKGVPAGKSSSQKLHFKDEVSFEKSFDDEFKDIQASSNKTTRSSDRQGLIDPKTASSARNERAEDSTKPKAQKEVRDARTDDEREVSKDATPSKSVAREAEEPVEESAKNEKSGDVDRVDAEESSDAFAPIALPVHELALAQTLTQSAGLAQDGQSMRSGAINSQSLPEEDSATGTEAGVEIPSEMTEVIGQTLTMNADDQEAVGLEMGANGGDAQLPEKAQTIKDFSTELWMHQNMNVESKLAGKSELNVQLAQDGAPQGSLPIKDLEPLISKLVTTKTGGEMNLQMRPAHLGMVKVEILTEGDAVRVNLFAEKASAQSALNSQVSDLKQQLHAVGLKVETVTVNALQSHSTEQSRDGQSQQQQARQHQENQQQRSSQRDSQKDFEMDAWSEEAA